MLLFCKDQPKKSPDYLIYTGSEDLVYHNIQHYNWKNMGKIQ